MPGYSRLIIFIISFLITINIYAKENKGNIDQTSLMLLAIDYENKEQFKKSKDAYLLLFKLDEKYEYLKHGLSLCLKTKDFDSILPLTAKYKHIFKEHEEKLSRLEIMALINIGQKNLALKFAYELLEKFNNADNYETVATILYSQNKYKESLKYFESAYASNKKAKTLLNLANVLYTYMDNKKTAISYLETYIALNGCSPIVCDRLLVYYQEDQNLDGMVSILKKVYKKYKNNRKKCKSLDKITNTIVDILKLKDINNAIKFLEENKILDIRLLTLYHQSKQYDKALKLTRTLYLKTKDVNFLAQLAILEYEMAENKADILDTVIANFTIALESIDSHTYQNYFGYILIDHDVDVKKGIKFVKKALEKEPNSIAYRDSLAWGYYKQHDCKKAKTIIEKLKDEIGLEDLEMKKHYDAIKECK